jgi:hypothetical protein
MAASVVSGFGPVFSGGAGPAILFPGRAGEASLEDLLVDELPSEQLPSVDTPSAPPARRVAPRGRRFEHGARPLSPTPSRPRASRPANRRLTTLPSTQRALPAQVARTTSRKLRLTRRGQLVLVLVIVAAVYAGFGLGRAGAGSQAEPANPHQVVVQQGDSLWAIAARALPNQDPRDVVGKIESLNHLQGSAVTAGQTLQLP